MRGGSGKSKSSPDVILYGQAGTRSRPPRPWAREQATWLSRYVGPLLRGFCERQKEKTSLNDFQKHGFKLQKEIEWLHRRIINSDFSYYPRSEDKELLEDLSEWLEDRRSPSIKAWSPLDYLQSEKDLLYELRRGIDF